MIEEQVEKKVQEQVQAQMKVIKEEMAEIKTLMENMPKTSARPTTSRPTTNAVASKVNTALTRNVASRMATGVPG
jgi:hypothetical protein